jgi:hypothetical protein
MTKKNNIINVIENQNNFIVYNSSATIIAEGDSLDEAYKKYQIKFDECNQIAKKLGIKPQQDLLADKKSKISIKKYILIFLILFILISTTTNVNNWLYAFPNKLRDSLLYANDGRPRCYFCTLEKVIDAVNLSIEMQKEEDIVRIRSKIEKLDSNLDKISGKK